MKLPYVISAKCRYNYTLDLLYIINWSPKEHFEFQILLCMKTYDTYTERRLFDSLNETRSWDRNNIRLLVIFYIKQFNWRIYETVQEHKYLAITWTSRDQNKQQLETHKTCIIREALEIVKKMAQQKRWLNKGFGKC